MNNFPISLNLENKKILVIGGGKIAFQKISKLLDFTLNITCISLTFCEEVKSLNIEKIEKAYEKSDLKDFDIVIITINNLEVHKQICFDCKEKRVFFSSSDFPNLSHFSFNSFLKKDDFILSVSSSGISPSFSKEFLKYLEKFIPKEIDSFLKDMKSKRECLPKGESRREFFKSSSREFFEKLKSKKV